MMDHPLLRPHVSLYKGGRMPDPSIPYEGELVFGEGDQLVEAAGRKFPRSVMNSTTCSRSQASSVMA